MSLPLIYGVFLPMQLGISVSSTAKNKSAKTFLKIWVQRSNLVELQKQFQVIHYMTNSFLTFVSY